MLKKIDGYSIDSIYHFGPNTRNTKYPMFFAFECYWARKNIKIKINKNYWLQDDFKKRTFKKFKKLENNKLYREWFPIFNFFVLFPYFYPNYYRWPYLDKNYWFKDPFVWSFNYWFIFKKKPSNFWILEENNTCLQLPSIKPYFSVYSFYFVETYWFRNLWIWRYLWPLVFTTGYWVKGAESFFWVRRAFISWYPWGFMNPQYWKENLNGLLKIKKKKTKFKQRRKPRTRTELFPAFFYRYPLWKIAYWWTTDYWWKDSWHFKRYENIRLYEWLGSLRSKGWLVTGTKYINCLPPEFLKMRKNKKLDNNTFSDDKK